MNTVDAIKDKKRIDAMKKVLKSHSQRDFLLFVMGINTGLRISDLLHLRWSNILDKKNKLLHVLILREQKTGKERKIVLNQTVRKALEETIAMLGDIN